MSIKGIGTDIVLKKRFSEKKGIEERFLSLLEKKELLLINNEKSKEDYISGRWAAKESIVKASDKKILFSKISILNSSTGKPEVFIEGKKTNKIVISISHGKEYTIAFSIIVN